MDTGPLALSHPQWPSWKLAPPIDGLSQGLIVSGFSDLPTGKALFLALPPSAGGAWLAALNAVAPTTSAQPPGGPTTDDQPRAAALAFTWTGLQRLGLPDSALASFTQPFVEGMFQEDRLRRLGDRRSGRWLDTVIPGGPNWSGNTPLRAPPPDLPGAFEAPSVASPETAVTTPVSVHALLLLYARDEADACAWATQVGRALASHQVTIAHTLDLVLDVEGSGISREHFGFADGLSQPAPYDENGAVTLDGKPFTTRDPIQGVPLGEFMIGYLNGHHEHSPGPATPGPDVNAAGASTPDPAKAGLPPHPSAEGFFDLGLNGSYLVARELRQDVAAFWAAMDRNAEAIRDSDPSTSSEMTAEWVAERVIGRNRDGHLLTPDGVLAPDSLGLPDDGFLYYDRDQRGAGCPLGSHIRRAFPRDTLAPTPPQKADLLQAANNHRLLRRARKFGSRIADPRIDDGAERGLLFMCLNTDIARQFEFVQQTWLLNSDFATLREEVDPLVGPSGRLTVRDQVLRRTVHVDTFVKMAGGEYFFLPSLPALRYLAML